MALCNALWLSEEGRMAQPKTFRIMKMTATHPLLRSLYAGQCKRVFPTGNTFFKKRVA